MENFQKITEKLLGARNFMLRCNLSLKTNIENPEVKIITIEEENQHKFFNTRILVYENCVRFYISVNYLNEEKVEPKMVYSDVWTANLDESLENKIMNFLFELYKLLTFYSNLNDKLLEINKSCLLNNLPTISFDFN
jgi:hypothetical protein